MSNPFKQLHRLIWRLEDRQRIAIGLGKGASMASRRIDPRAPASWEWSAFSQNGEDGILDVLRAHLRNRNRYFIEIGAADGITNNTAWLATAQNHGGLMVEGDQRQWQHARQLLPACSLAVECLHRFVTRDSAAELLACVAPRSGRVFARHRRQRLPHRERPARRGVAPEDLRRGIQLRVRP